MLKVAEQAHKTDTGKQRNTNEDSYFARSPIFAVADGMGGAQAGEVASSIAARAFETEIDEEGSAEKQLKEIFQSANSEIHALAEKDSSRAGMGTTLTTAIVRGDDVSIAHVGDSRAYVLRDGELKQLTKDHSLVEELRRQGRLTDEQAEEHPQRSIITRALGPEDKVKVDTMTFASRDGDVFLLSSDGLTTMVGEDRIRAILTESKSLSSAVSKLIDEANSAGGRDNITAVAFRVEAAGVGAEESPTLISSTAEQAGLTAERVREAARRVTPDRLAAMSPKRRWLRRAIPIAAALAVLIVGWLVLRSIYFVGTDSGGRVSLYRGLPYDLPLGLDLYSKQNTIPVQTASLTPERQAVVTEHELRSEDDAADILADIEQREGSVPPVPAPPVTPATPTAPAGTQTAPAAPAQKKGQ